MTTSTEQRHIHELSSTYRRIHYGEDRAAFIAVAIHTCSSTHRRATHQQRYPQGSPPQVAMWMRHPVQPIQHDKRPTAYTRQGLWIVGENLVLSYFSRRLQPHFHSLLVFVPVLYFSSCNLGLRPTFTLLLLKIIPDEDTSTRSS